MRRSPVILIAVAVGMVGLAGRLLHQCRFVVTGPESGYDTCDGPGGGLTAALNELAGTLLIGIALLCVVAAIIIQVFVEPARRIRKRDWS